MEWKTVERPGYFGKKRNELEKKWDEEFGNGNWRLAYQWGDIILPRDMGLQVYEDGYYEHFRRNPAELEWLVRIASNVYDTAETNIQAGFSYFQQETPNNHIHDVAIRRAVARHGQWFRGDNLVHVRWTGSEGYRVNPGVVPFHKPEMIIPGEINDYGGKGLWWSPGTIEDFYQRNKVLQIRD